MMHKNIFMQLLQFLNSLKLLKEDILEQSVVKVE